MTDSEEAGSDPRLDADRLDRALSRAYGVHRGRGAEAVSEALELLATLLPGRYRFTHEVARGKVASIFEGEDLNLGRAVALKALRSELSGDPAAVERFLREAQLEGQLQHPGIVPVYGLGLQDDGRPYFAMKLVKGETLAGLLARCDDIPTALPRLVGVFEQVCQTVAYAHARGVVHCDLEPANVLVGPFGEVQVVEWGAARLLDSETNGVDERTDVFALGLILREMLPGEPRSADDALFSIADRCLARHREECPRNAGEVAHLVAQYLAGAEQRAREAELRAAQEKARAREERDRARLARRKADWERRARGRLTAVAAVVVATTLLAGLLYLAKDRADRSRATETLGAVSEAMRKAADHESAGEWQQAVTWARTATATAQTGEAGAETLAPAMELLDRVEEGERLARAAARREKEDADMVARLARIRIQWRAMDRRDADEINATYSDAFTDFGIDAERIDVAEAAAAIRARGVSAELATALDEWSWGVTRARLGKGHGFSPRLWAKLLAIARQADPDEWRDRFRRGRLGPEPPAFETAAATADVGALPPGTLVLLARSLEQEGYRGTALCLLREAQRHHSGDYWVNALLARRLWDGGRPGEALEFQVAAIALRPHATSWSDLGGMLADVGRLDDAVRACRRAVEANDNYDKAWHHLAVALDRLGDAEGAITALRRAVELTPNAQGRLGWLAWLLATREVPQPGDAEEALRLATKAVHLASPNIQHWLALGAAHYRAGMYADAIKALDRVVQQRGQAYEMFFMAMAQKRLGRYEPAREHFERAVAWMEAHAVGDAVAIRLRAEAATVLEGGGK